PLSKRRLITSLARTSSFSESSLTAIPSVIVILRVTGTSSSGIGLKGTAGGKSAGRRGRNRPSRRGMHWAWLAGPPRNRGAHGRHLRLYSVCVDRLAGR